jgi:hypothetical protein
MVSQESEAILGSCLRVDVSAPSIARLACVLVGLSAWIVPPLHALPDVVLAPQASATTQEAQFSVVESRTTDVSRVEAAGNVAAGASGPEVAEGARGVWVDPAQLMRRPTSGLAWERMLADAGRDHGRANIADQDSNHDVYTLAAAFVCVRDGRHCDKARQGVLDAIGTESGARWLAVGRNLGAYVIAADVLNMRADGVPDSDGTRVHEWIESWLGKELLENHSSELRAIQPFHSGNNAAVQEGFAFVAVAAYLRRGAALDRAWKAFRAFVCDAGAPDTEQIDLEPAVEDGWAHDVRRPCAVNPSGARKTVPVGLRGAGGTYSVDGALVGDMRRGGVYQWRPAYTSLPWVGLEGLVPAAVILSRAGYPAFEVADRAILRAHEYLWHLRRTTGDPRWFDGTRAREIVHLVNAYYRTSYPVNDVTGGGRTVGYTAWTHPLE